MGKSGCEMNFGDCAPLLCLLVGRGGIRRAAALVEQ